jgi:MerR family mercuric resistance operon transcriptional regulator
MKKSSATYSRGQLATLTNVKGETIRYYETSGLLGTPARSQGGHRIYSEEHVRQLIFIRRCRELGFTLNEIQGLLSLASSADKTCEQVRHATADHLSDVQKKIKDLRKMERTLKELISQCETNATPECPIIDALFS